MATSGKSKPPKKPKSTRNSGLRRRQASGDRGDDAKPRLRMARKKGSTIEQRALAELRAGRAREDMKTTGRIRLVDRGKSGGKSGVVYGATGPQGGISVNPATQVAWEIRKALNPHYVMMSRRSDCIVYDGDGKPVEVIDGVTRQRRPYTP